MAFNYEEFHSTMRRKYGEDWREIMRQRGAEGGKAKVSKGFGRMTPERRAEVSAKGVAARRNKNVPQ